MSTEDLRALPKVLLHHHLDGGLRPQTVLDLAEATGYEHLPANDLEGLTEWFFQGRSASLERYLKAFDHTIGVMQTADAIERVAYETVEDLAADGVLYAEIRMAPALATERDLEVADVIGAILAGLGRAESDFGLPARLIVDAMRQDSDSLDIAKVAVAFAGKGVVGFDLAGPEAGFPATLHREACEVVLSAGLHLTIHAGEGAGVGSISGALEVGTQRLGHGVRLVEDMEFVDGEVHLLGPVAQAVFDSGLVLEVCPTSNMHTGMFTDPALHPLGALHRFGFAVTINTDNVLMSQTSATGEFRFAADHHGFDVADFELVSMRAIDAAFCDQATKDRVIQKVLAGYDSVG